MKYIVVFEDPRPDLEGDVYGPFESKQEADRWADSLPEVDEPVSWEVWPLRAPI